MFFASNSPTSVAFLFILLTGQKILISVKSSLSVLFFFMDFTFALISKERHHQTQGCLYLLLCSILRVSWFCILLRSFWISFCPCLDLFVCVWMFSCSSIICWKFKTKQNYRFSIVLPLLFYKHQLTVFKWVHVWAFCSVSFMCMSLPLPVPYCFDYCNFMVSLEVLHTLVLQLYSSSILC